jgi:hypothetical protein
MNILKPLAVAAMSVALAMTSSAQAAEVPSEFYGDWCGMSEGSIFIRPHQRKKCDFITHIDANGIDLFTYPSKSCVLVDGRWQTNSFTMKFTCDGGGTPKTQRVSLRLVGGKLLMKAMASTDPECAILGRCHLR